MIPKKKILVVDDDPTIRKALTLRLRHAGFAVVTAEDGNSALETARMERPDVIVLDLKLPQLRGEEVCKAIREDHDKAFACVPIIMLTGKTSDVDRVIGMVIGASCYITKPYRSDQLMKQIRKFAGVSIDVPADA